ncbi:flagellar basal body rod protein FlgC [Solidesulfovibrio sp. C21]|uniref:flagellar basal body rod protein FlgC n=1 Tax=Solidesulfovibrio sp. C21 TaxID=3398613 RepID=UPI0039FC0C7A
MTDAISAAQSALGALSTSMAVTANNVANVNTDGYKSQDARLSTGPDGQGTQVSSIVEDTSAGALRAETVAAENQAGVYEPQMDMVEMSNVDLVRQNVNMIQDSRAFEANVAVIRTADDMAGTLLDLRV